MLGQLFINQIPFDLAALHAPEKSATAKPVAMPVLQSALPFIQLSEAEASHVRAMLDDAAQGGAARVAPGPRPLAPVVAEESPAIEGVASAQTPLADLSSNASSRADAKVSSWSGCLPLPFAAAVEMVALENAPDSDLRATHFADHLGRGDIAYFGREIQPLGRFRQRDWLVGRMAARRAVSAWMGGSGDHAEFDPQFGYDAAGRPVLIGETAEPIFLSVSHKDGIGAAVAADRPIGIDLERLTAVRDPRLLMQTAFSPVEQELLLDAGWGESSLIAIAWSAKEAAAKSIGRKLLGHETSMAITSIDTEQRTIRLAHAQAQMDAFYELDGDYVCVVAAA